MSTTYHETILGHHCLGPPSNCDGIKCVIRLVVDNQHERVTVEGHSDSEILLNDISQLSNPATLKLLTFGMQSLKTNICQNILPEICTEIKLEFRSTVDNFNVY